MHSSSFQEAKAAHDSLMSALAEFKASEPQTDALLGAFGLAITFTTNGEEFTGRLSHVDGAWIETGPIQCSAVETAVSVGRLMLLGIDFAATTEPSSNADSEMSAGDWFVSALLCDRK